MATEYCIKRKWIESSIRDWGIYAFEKKLLSLSFFVMLCLLAGIIKKPLEVATFSATTIMFRRRIGGWHAAHAASCQCLSIAIVILAVGFCGPLVLKLPTVVIYCVDFLTMVIGFLISPCYPQQLNFTMDEIAANTKKKNHVICWIIVIQICSLVFLKNTVVVYSLLGMLTGILSVYIEKLHQRTRKDE